MKLNIDPESLVPKLPSPKDLQPFPNVFAIEYKGIVVHNNFYHLTFKNWHCLT